MSNTGIITTEEETPEKWYHIRSKQGCQSMYNPSPQKEEEEARSRDTRGMLLESDASTQKLAESELV